MAEARFDIPAGRQIDMHDEDMDRDWRGAMARVYRFLEMDHRAGATGDGRVPGARCCRLRRGDRIATVWLSSVYAGIARTRRAGRLR